MSRRASAAAVCTGALAVRNVRLVVWGVEVLAVPAGGEDDGLTDQLARGALGNRNSVATRARGAANKGVLAGGSPASMADCSRLDFAVVGVGG